MAETDENLVSSVNSLQINGEQGVAENEGSPQKVPETWSFPVEELYKIALKFYKDKEGSKAMSLTYKDRLRLVAYTKQVSFGSYRADVSPEVGFLDVVGNDRRTDLNEWQAWQTLGEMSRDEAMQEFVTYLDALCPLFRPYMQAHHADKEEQERRRQEEEEKKKREDQEQEKQRVETEAKQQQEVDKQKYLQQEVQIRTALNQQTAIQFKQYAEQQHPGQAEQQEILIKQLQEQHFQQYMQQVYQQQLLHQQQQFQQLRAMAASDRSLTDINLQTTEVPVPLTDAQLQSSMVLQSETGGGLPQNGLDPAGHPPPQPLVTDSQVTEDGLQQQQLQLQSEQQPQQQQHEDEENENDDENGYPPIAAASMWTRKDLKEFKDSLRKDPDSVIKVGSGETVTVRVPTHEDGTCLFWEFATDSYDVGFGVYFEWTISPSNQVSVHVSESSDEEDIEDEEGGGSAAGGDIEGSKAGDIEKGGSSRKENRPPTDEIIPVYRRDCHDEVYCGSHMYPGRGVYLLKFDNSYSLWRSKTLYYRVYYTR